MKKIISVILAFVMLILCLPASAEVNGFPDVKKGAWYYEAVNYCAEKGIFNGNKDGTFAPSKQISRAEFAVVLANYSGEDYSAAECNEFKDVKPSHWFYRAIAWAYNNGIIYGIGNNLFSPTREITRQDLCVMIDRFLEYKGIIYETTSDNQGFADGMDVSPYAVGAVGSMVNAGVISGMGNNMLMPKGSATRAQVSQIMMKLDQFLDSEDVYDMNIERITIKIPGLPGLSAGAKFMHISDSHLTLYDETDSEQAVKEMTERGTMFDTQVGDGIKREDKLTALYKLAEQEGVNRIILSGDIIDAPTNGNMKFLSNLVSNSSVRSVYCLGNHDWSFSDNYQGERDKYMPGFTDIFGEVDPDTEEKYWDDVCNVYDYGNYAIVVADNSNDQVHSYITTVLKNYANAGTPVILVLHVPVSCETAVEDVTNMWGRDITIGSAALNPNAQTQQFVDFIRSEDSTVVAILAGHTHLSHIGDVSPNNDTVQYTLGASFEGYARIFEIAGE